MTKNYCVWSASRNRDYFRTGQVSSGRFCWEKRQREAIASEKDRKRDLKKSVIRTERSHYE
jgi:hypothetical protein